jgi:cell division protein FtsQ
LQQVGGVAESSWRVQHAPAPNPSTAPNDLQSRPSARSAVSLGPLPPSPLARRLTRRRSLGRKLGLAVFAALSGALAFSLLTDAGRQTREAMSLLPEADQVLFWTGLRIDQVALSGQRFTPDSDIFDALDLANARSLLTFHSNAARGRIEALPWIETASITREIPGALEVRVTERKPLWLHEGREILIDSSGRVLSALKPGTRVKLPRIAGEGAPEHAQALIELLTRYPAIAERFEVAERVGGRRWSLRFKNGVRVELGVDREAVAFAGLSSSEDLGKLLDGHDLIIDLRTRGRITVRAAGPEASAQTASNTQS